MSTRRIGFLGSLAVVAAVVASGLAVQRLVACPFCSAVSLTFSEEIANAQVAVVAKLVDVPKPADSAQVSTEVSKAKFEITKVLKGGDALGKTRVVDTIYFGDNKPGTKFLIMGIDPPNINWGTPIAITDRAEEYVEKAMGLPAAPGAERLVFFQDFLEDSDEMLARDAYDEFAKTPYAGVVALKDKMKHDQIIEWIKSTKIPVSRRRLYLTMLGVCGTKDDLPVLEEMIQSKDRQTKGALDALVAAYLTLKGPDGMPLIEDLYLKNKDAEYTDTYAAIMALRFHGTEEKIVPRERLLQGLRAMLDRPQLADLVIPDLARWEDWSVVNQLVDLFKNADEESSWVRVPVINYLRACPLPEAKKHIDELAKLDPETVKRANSFFPLTGTAQPATAEGAKPAGDAAAAVGAEAAKPPASEGAPAQEPPAKADAGTPAKPAAAKPEPAAGAAAPTPAAEQPAEKGIVVLSSGESDAVVAPPAVPQNNLPIFGGLAAAAMLLGCAFWAILKGGRHATA